MSLTGLSILARVSDKNKFNFSQEIFCQQIDWKSQEVSSGLVVMDIYRFVGSI